MSARDDGLRAAERAAEQVLHRFGVRAATHIKIEAFASAFGLTIVDGQLDGARARLTRGTRPQIRVSERTPSEEARRFSIAHELGHHRLDHEGERTHAMCAQTAPRRGYHPHRRDLESEAQVFAAGVLMPRALVAPLCDVAEPSLAVAQRIAADFRTSLPASAIRFVELTPLACAVVHSAGGAITWAVRSRTFAARIARNRPLAADTLAAAFAAAGTAGTPSTGVRGEVPARAWIDAPDGARLVEHALPVAEGGVISLLS